MSTIASNDTACRKCKAPMPPIKNSGGGFLQAGCLVVTGYRCNCGHWNDLKRRKAKPVVPAHEGDPA